VVVILRRVVMIGAGKRNIIIVDLVGMSLTSIVNGEMMNIKVAEK
jgi:hypothetical protein